MNKNSFLQKSRNTFYQENGLFKFYRMMSKNRISESDYSNQTTNALWDDLKKRNVLIIDDNKGFRLTFAARLCEIFNTVDDVSSGYEGLDKVKNGGFYDVIFIDMFMKKHSALDVYDALKEASKDTLIYIMTAAESNRHEYMTAILKSIPICSKPVDEKIFLNISKILREDGRRGNL